MDEYKSSFFLALSRMNAFLAWVLRELNFQPIRYDQKDNVFTLTSFREEWMHSSFLAWVLRELNFQPIRYNQKDNDSTTWPYEV